MEIILSPRCKSFTGTISRYHGYAIRRSGKRFFSYRTPGKHAKPDGHWKFIVSCAELARNGFMLADIQVNGYELKAALTEACFFYSALHVDVDIEYNATQVLQFKNKRGL